MPGKYKITIADPLEQDDILTLMKMIFLKNRDHTERTIQGDLSKIMTQLVAYIVQLCGYYIYTVNKIGGGEKEKKDGLFQNIFILLYILAELCYSYDKDDTNIDRIVWINDTHTFKSEKEKNLGHLFMSSGNINLCTQDFHTVFYTFSLLLKNLINCLCGFNLNIPKVSKYTFDHKTYFDRVTLLHYNQNNIDNLFDTIRKDIRNIFLAVPDDIKDLYSSLPDDLKKNIWELQDPNTMGFNSNIYRRACLRLFLRYLKIDVSSAELYNINSTTNIFRYIMEKLGETIRVEPEHIERLDSSQSTV